MSVAHQNRLLEGVRVLDLSQYIPGPYASLKMLELGAEVIKIESPHGDPMRSLGEAKEGVSPLYRYLNRGKNIIEIDLKSESGCAVLSELVGAADVLLEGFRPGTLERLGFGYQALHRINPKLVICSLSGFGQQGERAQRAGHDLGYLAGSGLYTRPAGQDKPQLVFPPVADHAAALKALAMVSAALYQQQNSGQGCVLDVSIEAAVADWQYMFQSESLGGDLSGDTACYNIYQTADDRYVSLAALESKFWVAFCDAVGRFDWIPRHQEISPQRGLIKELQNMFIGWPLYVWQEKLGGVDCCFEVIATRDELLESAEIDQPLSGRMSPDSPAVQENIARWRSA